MYRSANNPIHKVFHEKFLENFRETSSKSRAKSSFDNWSYCPVFTNQEQPHE
jgi:hypothetical protein